MQIVLWIWSVSLQAKSTLSSDLCVPSGWYTCYLVINTPKSKIRFEKRIEHAKLSFGARIRESEAKRSEAKRSKAKQSKAKQSKAKQSKAKKRKEKKRKEKKRKEKKRKEKKRKEKEKKEKKEKKGKKGKKNIASFYFKKVGLFTAWFSEMRPSVGTGAYLVVNQITWV